MDTNNGQLFGTWLKRKREEADLTLEALGELVGKTKGYISKLERATRHTTTNAPPKPSFDLVLKFAKVLNALPEEALVAAGYELPQTMRAKENVEVLYFDQKKYSSRRQAEAKRIFDMARRELDRLAREDRASNK